MLRRLLSRAGFASNNFCTSDFAQILYLGLLRPIWWEKRIFPAFLESKLTEARIYLRRVMRRFLAVFADELRKLVCGGLFAYFAFIVFWLLASPIAGDSWSVVRIFSYFAPAVFGSLLPLAVISFFLRQRRLSALFLVCFCVLGFKFDYLILNNIGLKEAHGSISESKKLTVVSFNLGHGHVLKSEIQEFADVDIMAIQELREHQAKPFIRNSKDIFDYFLYQPEERLAIFSKYPLVELERPQATKRSLKGKISTPHGDIVVWNIHAPLAIHTYFWRQQREFLEAVSADSAKIDIPMIVLGDFNTTEGAQNFHILRSKFNDLHRAVGSGFGFTYRAPGEGWSPKFVRYFDRLGALLRIDNILYDYHFEPKSIRVFENSFGSDHYPVMGELSLGAE